VIKALENAIVVIIDNRIPLKIMIEKGPVTLNLADKNETNGYCEDGSEQSRFQIGRLRSEVKSLKQEGVPVVKNVLGINYSLLCQ